MFGSQIFQSLKLRDQTHIFYVHIHKASMGFFQKKKKILILVDVCTFQFYVCHWVEHWILSYYHVPGFKLNSTSFGLQKFFFWKILKNAIINFQR